MVHIYANLNCILTDNLNFIGKNKITSVCIYFQKRYTDDAHITKIKKKLFIKLCQYLFSINKLC